MTEALEFGQVELSQYHQDSCDEQLNFEINFGIVHVSEMIQIRGAFVVVHPKGLKPVCRSRNNDPATAMKPSLTLYHGARTLFQRRTRLFQNNSPSRLTAQ